MEVTDPVCGVSLALEKTQGQEKYEGWAYFYCSNACHRLFNHSPKRFSLRKETALVGANPPRRVECE